MKNLKGLLSVSVIALLLMACNEDDAPSTFNLEGNWEIAMVIVGWGQPDMAGAEIPFTDTYTFDADGSFIRNRVDGELVMEGSGVYVVSPRAAEDPSGHLYRVELTYNTGSDMASNCHSGGAEASRENLVILDDHSLLTTWQVCDGPAYYYKRK